MPPILKAIHGMMECTTNRGIIVVILDELKSVKATCLDQPFALYPIVNLCEQVFPSQSIFLEWCPSINGGLSGQGSILAFRTAEERSRERFIDIHWLTAILGGKGHGKVLNYRKQHNETGREATYTLSMQATTTTGD